MRAATLKSEQFLASRTSFRLAAALVVIGVSAGATGICAK
jgi:hypothetical protein